ncbi:hypothetical protein GUJ93_ZPchr0006g45062 [Zizania palustris]|uniref:Uncharacterized protein n=1 Tax=Zizania palustris TaxID=103762 RepID=A0A8J5W1D1_ZIZPA|nr:hypothetical protein GUJ93_ZPchr0006g45062 [Zizania palustris]
MVELEDLAKKLFRWILLMNCPVLEMEDVGHSWPVVGIWLGSLPAFLQRNGMDEGCTTIGGNCSFVPTSCSLLLTVKKLL